MVSDYFPHPEASEDERLRAEVRWAWANHAHTERLLFGTWIGIAIVGAVVFGAWVW